MVATSLGLSLFSGAAQAATPPPGHIKAPQATAYGTIGNYHSGKCLDDTNGSGSNGTQMQQWTCLYNANQNWRVRYFVDLSGTYADNIQVEKSGKCLDLAGGSSANGAWVIQYSCNTSDDAQLWYPIQTNISGWYNFQNAASGTCMTVSADSQSNGAKIQGWSCTTADEDHAYFWEPHFDIIG